jgi:hypothetical protein
MSKLLTISFCEIKGKMSKLLTISLCEIKGKMSKLLTISFCEIKGKMSKLLTISFCEIKGKMSKLLIIVVALCQYNYRITDNTRLVSASGLMFSSQFLRHILAITNYIFMR